MKNGSGIVLYSDGSKFEGEFKDNIKLEGRYIMHDG